MELKVIKVNEVDELYDFSSFGEGGHKPVIVRVNREKGTLRALLAESDIESYRQDCYTCPIPPLTAASANELLEEITPHAQCLIEADSDDEIMEAISDIESVIRNFSGKEVFPMSADEYFEAEGLDESELAARYGITPSTTEAELRAISAAAFENIEEGLWREIHVMTHWNKYFQHLFDFVCKKAEEEAEV